jgi:hypothetical protein
METYFKHLTTFEPILRQKGGSCWIDANMVLYFNCDYFKKLIGSLFFEYRIVNNIIYPSKVINYGGKKTKKAYCWYIFKLYLRNMYLIKCSGSKKTDDMLLQYEKKLEHAIHTTQNNIGCRSFGSMYGGGNAIAFMTSFLDFHNLGKYIKKNIFIAKNDNIEQKLNVLIQDSNTFAIMYTHDNNKGAKHSVSFYKKDDNWYLFSNKEKETSVLIKEEYILEYIMSFRIEIIMVLRKKTLT